MTKNLKLILLKHKFELSRMIAYSKSTYVKKFPDRKPIFNSNIVSETEGKVWWGDVDLVSDAEALQKVADEYGAPIYIVREMDCRFENETRPFSEIQKVAVVCITPSSFPSPAHPASSPIQCLQSLANKALQFCFGKKKS